MRLISLEFYAFSALTLLVYRLFPSRWRWWVLCLASALFYLSFGLPSLICALLISLSSYAFALLLQKCRKEGSKFILLRILCMSVSVILMLWSLVKLTGEIPWPSMPLGISFYSLRVIGYLVDVKRGSCAAERNFFKLMLFVCFFPMALLGPVMSYSELSKSLFSGRKPDSERSVAGLIRISFGIFKKLVIANTLAIPNLLIAEGGERFGGAYVLFPAVLYSAEVYCDFSGGMDIALGIGSLFGIELSENFDRPFSSVTVREFWNRWHMSLGHWFEHYVFYPISLSKPMQRLSCKARQKLGVRLGRKLPLYIAAMLTWSMTGLWHGARANFLVWGLINGALVIISQETAPLFEKIAVRYPAFCGSALFKIARRMRVFFLIGAVRLLDLYGSVQLTFRMLGTVFYDLEGYLSFLGGGIFDLIELPRLIIVLAALLLVFLVSEYGISSKKLSKKPIASAVCVFSLVFLSLLLGRYGAGFAADDFIYSKF